MTLSKASATGNDFIIIDLLNGERFAEDRATFARATCDRHDGVGADGAVFLEPAPGYDFKWDFFNSDGGRAEMCGNAARAVGLYVREKLKQDHLRFLTTVGEVKVSVRSPECIEVQLGPIDPIERRSEYTFVRAGVPHAVLRAPDARDLATLRARALEIKARPEFSKDGVNVTFYTPHSGVLIDAITFERGVEDFTLSCGTGAVAAAFAHRTNNETVTVQVRVPGGELSVVCHQDRPVLIGPARLIARFDWLS